MQVNDTLIVPIVVGLVEVAKRLGLPSKLAPILAIILGVTGAVLLNGQSTENIFFGIVYGLTSAGLYSGTKAIIE